MNSPSSKEDEMNEIVKMVNDELTSLLMEWREQEQASGFEREYSILPLETTSHSSNEEKTSSLSSDLPISASIPFSSPTTNQSNQPQQPHHLAVSYLPPSSPPDMLDTMPIPLSSDQVLPRFRSDLLLHIYYNLYIKMNVIVLSSNPYKLTGIMDALKLMVQIAEANGYYGLEYYTEAMVMSDQDILVKTAEFANDANGSFIACVHSSRGVLQKYVLSMMSMMTMMIMTSHTLDCYCYLV